MASALPVLGKNVDTSQQGDRDERKALKPWQKQPSKLDPIPEDKRGTIGGVLGQARALFPTPLEKRDSTGALGAAVATQVFAKAQEASPTDFGQRGTVITDAISDARAAIDDPLAQAKAEELAKIEAKKWAQIRQLGLLKTAFCDNFILTRIHGILSHYTTVRAKLTDAPTTIALDKKYLKLSPEQQSAYNWVVIDLQTKVKQRIKHSESEIALLQDLTSQQLLKDVKSLSLVNDIQKICPDAFSDPDTYIP